MPRSSTPTAGAAPVAIAREYTAAAAEYDRRWAAYTARTVAATLTQLPLAGAATLLDVGCGTGALLAAVHQQSPRVRCVGVDRTAAMLAVAAPRLRGPNILAVADAVNLPVADAAVDIVVSSSSLHFWSDVPRALRECHRVLVPGGQIVITDWCGDDLPVALYDQWRRWRTGAQTPALRESTLRAALTDAGFVVQASRRFRATWFWGMMTVRARKAVHS